MGPPRVSKRVDFSEKSLTRTQAGTIGGAIQYRRMLAAWVLSAPDKVKGQLRSQALTRNRSSPNGDGTL